MGDFGGFVSEGALNLILSDRFFTTWRMGSQDGRIRSDRIGPPIYFSHGVISAIWKGSHVARSLGDLLLTIVASYLLIGMILQVLSKTT